MTNSTNTVPSLAHEIEEGLNQHIDQCRKDEAERFGAASEYEVRVTVEENLIHVYVGAAPTPDTVKTYGRTRTNPSFIDSQPLQTRFWARSYQFRHDPDTNTLAFYSGHHAGFKRESAVLLDDKDFQTWMPRRVNVIARHLTGRIPWEHATRCGAKGMEKAAENRAKEHAIVGAS